VYSVEIYMVKRIIWKPLWLIICGKQSANYWPTLTPGFSPVSTGDASSTENRAAVMQMIRVYVAKSTIHHMSDP
jgi:hypothetical protein